jgi:transcriptional regulator with XRE-family HTH domain
LTALARQTLTAATTFGPSLRAVREALSLPQAACARSMSVTKNTLHNLERGTDSRISSGMLALAMLGAAMGAMREGIGLSEAQIAKQTGLAVAIVKAIEAGLSFDMPALLALAQTYKSLAASAAIRRSTAE